jgi:hypothetical protein
MSLIALILGLAVVGLVLWLVVTYIPMPEPYKRVVVILIVVLVVLWVIGRLGFDITIPRTP